MFFISFFGGLKAVVRPVPIPNTAVKRSVADGSGFIDSARVGRRQSFKKSRNESFGFFIAQKFWAPNSAAIRISIRQDC